MTIELHQYWHDAEPPDEVAQIVAAWQGMPGLRHRLWSRATAAALLSARCPPPVAAAFDACAVPAMQADLFRLALLSLRGGAWIDADIAPRGADIPLVDFEGRGLLMRRGRRIANDVIFVARPGDPLMQAALAVAVDNVTARRPGSIWSLTGPGVLTALFHDRGTRPLFAGFRVRLEVTIARHVSFEWGLAYKRGPDDWRQSEKRRAPIYV